MHSVRLSRQRISLAKLDLQIKQQLENNAMSVIESQQIYTVLTSPKSTPSCHKPDDPVCCIFQRVKLSTPPQITLKTKSEISTLAPEI